MVHVSSSPTECQQDRGYLDWIKSKLAKLTTGDCSFQIGGSTIQPPTIVRDLGVYLDRELSMKQHIAKVAASCYYHLLRLRQIRRRVSGEVATRLVLALITFTFAICYRSSVCRLSVICRHVCRL